MIRLRRATGGRGGASRHGRGRGTVLAATVAVGAIVLAACGSSSSPGGSTVGAGSTSSGSGGSVNLAVNSWVGSQADVSLACWLIENQLKQTCKQTTIDEVPTWSAMATGKIDGVLEVWGHEDLYKQYVTNQKKVVDAGLTGPDGHIGWYVPTYLVKDHPELATWEGLKNNVALFKTAESGSAGQFLDGSPSYVTNDGPLLKNLGLNYKVVYAGSEAAEITAIQKAYAAKKPLLFYWYTPQWLNNSLAFTEVKLPAYTTGCDADTKTIKCAYPTYKLYKAMSTAFTTKNPKAAALLKNFTLTPTQQNDISGLIADKNMKPDAAAAQWATANESVWKSWLTS